LYYFCISSSKMDKVVKLYVYYRYSNNETHKSFIYERKEYLTTVLYCSLPTSNRKRSLAKWSKIFIYQNIFILLFPRVMPAVAVPGQQPRPTHNEGYMDRVF
jgi:hypothetical protein